MSEREPEYLERGVELLAVNAFEDPQAGKDWIAGSGLHYRWTFADEAVTEAFGVAGVPTQIILDREGRIVWTSSFTSLMGGADAVWAALDDVLGAADPG